MARRCLPAWWLRAPCRRAVYGVFPANSCGDDIILYTDASHQQERMRLHMLRQQKPHAKGCANYCLADFVAPRSSGLENYIGAFVVATGHGLDPIKRGGEPYGVLRDVSDGGGEWVVPQPPAGAVLHCEKDWGGPAGGLCGA
jgi:hypothetical protein